MNLSMSKCFALECHPITLYHMHQRITIEFIRKLKLPL